MVQASQPRISAVIPVKNEAASIARCLEGILSQTVPVEEIIVIDSGSTDGTQAIARRFPKVRLIEIPPSEFNHGDTRNLGAREAVGDLVLFTVGDARPASNDWLQLLLAGFVSDEVVAVWGAQVVPESERTNPVEWFRPASSPQIELFGFANADAFNAADPEKKWRATSLDDVTSLYYRRILQEIPFRRATYGEDVLFARDALLAGHTIAYNPAARVFHFHYENYATVFKRTIVVASSRLQMTGYETPPHRFAYNFLRILWRLVREPKLSWIERAKWARYNYQIGRAIRDGLAKVRTAQEQGGDAVQRLHDAYCGTAPAPLKNLASA